jgi:hypothetical protein
MLLHVGLLQGLSESALRLSNRPSSKLLMADSMLLLEPPELAVVRLTLVSSGQPSGAAAAAAGGGGGAGADWESLSVLWLPATTSLLGCCSRHSGLRISVVTMNLPLRCMVTWVRGISALLPLLLWLVVVLSMLVVSLVVMVVAAAGPWARTSCNSPRNDDLQDKAGNTPIMR